MNRIGRLVTGRYGWRDTVTDEVEVVREDWGTRWALDGIHSYNWAWVRRFCALECGCIRSPFTLRKVIICWDHAGLDLLPVEGMLD